MADKFTDGQLFNFISGSKKTGESAYDIWKSLGNDGTPEDFIEYLKNDNVDDTLSETSINPIQNKVVAKKFNEVSTETANVKQEIAVERERVNTFTALEDGSTTGDAELIDARIDYTGKTWDNVGEHIRGVSSQLSEQIDNSQDVIKSDLNHFVSDVTDGEIILLSNGTILERAWIPENGTKILDSTTDDCKVIWFECSPNTTYTIRKKKSNAFRVARANNMPTIEGFVGGTISNNDGTEITITTISETNYLVVYYAFNDENDIDILKSIEVTCEKTSAKDKKARKDIDSLNSDINYITCMSFEGKYTISMSDIVQGTYKDADASVNPVTNRIRVGKVIRVKKGMRLEFTPTENCQKMLYGFKNKTDISYSASKWFAEKTTIIFEEDCLVAIIFAYLDNRNISVSDFDGEVIIFDDTEVKPYSYPYEVGFKKSKQLSTIEWEAKKGIPKAGGQYYRNANTTYKGLPYSDSHSNNKRVCFDVTLKTFMTALNNPYSLMYTENINETYSTSAYGNVYKGDGLQGAYMGISCNLFLMYCLGSPIPYSSEEICGWALEEGIFTRVYDQSANGLNPMDILVRNGHVILVSRVFTDVENHITHIQLSESVEPFVVENKLMTASEFNTYIANEGYTIVRYRDLYKNINYEKSPFVNLAGESGSYTYNNDICTFAGDYACFGEGELLHINYTKGNYASMEIYKNDALIDTITLNSSADIHDVDLTSKNYTFGMYKARLTNGTSHSDYTYWEILKCNINAVGDTLNFETNAEPLYWFYCNNYGYSYKKNIVTDSEKQSNSIDIRDRKANYNNLKFVVKGNYGCVTRELENL